VIFTVEDNGVDDMTKVSRRSLVLGGLATAGLGLAGCARDPSISSDPHELVLWYWKRSISDKLLDVARKQIPGTQSRIRADLVGTNFDVKLRTSLAGGAYIPDVTGLNSNVSLYFPNESQFIDYNEFGAKDLKADYLPWKWQLGVTPSDRFCFWPMDTGPTGLYYRADLMEKAGLPSSPDDVSTAVRTWDGYLDVGRQLRQKAGLAIAANATAIYTQVLNASETRYFDPSGKPIFTADGSTVRKAWDIAVQAAQAGITAKLQTDTEVGSGFNSSKVVANIEAVWWIDVLKDLAPDTEGSWRVARQPVRPGNSGGSFLGVPKVSKDPESAFRFVSWLTSPANQVISYDDVDLFPSAIGALKDPALAKPDPFFGGQDVFDLFQKSAQQVPLTFISPYENRVSTAITTELVNVELGQKTSDQAWRDAMDLSERQLQKKGLV
jgi:cellobiose transport system substrate-binding protein